MLAPCAIHGDRSVMPHGLCLCDIGGACSCRCHSNFGGRPVDYVPGIGACCQPCLTFGSYHSVVADLFEAAADTIEEILDEYTKQLPAPSETFPIIL